MTVSIRSVLTGVAAPFGPKGEASAYRKSEVSGPVAVDILGLAGDEQADREHHGGVEKAILHYALDHYADWREERPELQEHLSSPGAFGENIATVGLTETQVSVGDRFRLGSATVEVSQGRQPCWKLGHRFEEPAMVQQVIRTGRCGWYYRVLEPGEVAAEDSLELLARPYPGWTVARVFGIVVGQDRGLDSLRALVELPPLSRSWREKAHRILGNVLAAGRQRR